jgi:hypothetical protein
MRRLIAWIGGVAGGIAAYRFVRRHEAALQTSPEQATSDQDARAEELRAKLADSRSTAPEPEWTAPATPAVASEQESPDERRRRVHEEGRAAVDEMTSE